MSTEQSPDWLPAGWTSRSKSNGYGKKIKFYVDPATGRKFHSRAQVVKYLEEAKTETIPELAITSVEAKTETIPELAITSVDNVVNKANESKPNGSPDWLPDGWTVEEKTRNNGSSAGSKFKVYIDPKSGHKFYSKPQVYRYLAKISSSSDPQLGINAVNGVSSTVEETKQTNEETKQTNEETKQTNEELNQTIEETKQTNESLEWLPQGWSVESKTGEGGKKRKVYTDPASGFKFYSKPQVSRYLEKINSSPQIVSSNNFSPQIVTGSANDVGPVTYSVSLKQSDIMINYNM